MPKWVGPTFADYTIVRLIGAGGMGEVYLAQHPRLPRRDALKLLARNVSADPSFRERFLREAELASTLWHPHIVGVHDRGEYEGQLWISMDFVDGEDAGKLLARRYPAGMPPDLVTTIITAVAAALDYAHKQGLLHRDVKPANILVTNVSDEDERRILLTDFGIARTADEVSGLTATNATVGTLAYTAPEQLRGEDIDGRADQYSLAATAYHLLTGRALFRESNPAVLIGRHLSTPPPLLAHTRSELAPLDPALATALAKDPRNRFASCSDFARALVATTPPDLAAGGPTMAAPAAEYPPYPTPQGQPGPQYWQSPPPPRASRAVPLLWGLAIAAALAVGLVGMMLFAWSQRESSTASSASTSAIIASTSVSSARWPSTTEDMYPSTVQTAYPTTTYTYPTSIYIAPPPLPAPPPVNSWSAVVVGTCDEGGSCGVKQRTTPKVEAPRMYPNDLQDGVLVSVVCQKQGDVRSSRGHGSSSIWYRLDNGAYVNSVYLDLQDSVIPWC